MFTWLLEQASKVYYWFGSNFWTLVNKLISLPSDLSSWVGGKINAALNTVTGWINDVYKWANKQLNAVYNWASGIVNDAYNTIVKWVNGLVNSINSAIDAAKTWAYDKAKGLADSVTDYVNQVKRDLQKGIDTVQGNLNSAIKPFQDIYKPIVALINFFTPDVIKKVSDFVHTLYDFITGFMSDPMGFVLSIVWDRIFDLICYGLGYGLGSVQATLPPLPSWSSFGGPITGDGVTPSERLTKPLKRLYVSGYTFSSTHPGVDFGATYGEEVYAAHNGIVQEAGWSTVGYGINIVLSGDPWWTRYGHLKEVNVVTGQNVTAGQVIGHADTTGNSTGNHLHFEVKYKGQFINPLDVLSLG
jgi:murein DD-endopeptidase MepM/ murein hydrolase activator NlpD